MWLNGRLQHLHLTLYLTFGSLFPSSQRSSLFVNMMEVAQVAAVDMEDVSNEDEHEACEVEKEDADSAHKDSTSKEDAKADRRTRRTRTKNKENEKEAVNGVTKDGETNMNEDQNASELALKKEVWVMHRMQNS